MNLNKNNTITIKAKNVKILACDVDGVLTNGKIIMSNNIEEIKIWNVKDGFGYNELAKIIPKIKTAWITAAKSSNQVKWRAKNLQIDCLIQNCSHKKNALEKILKKNKLNMSEVAYIGDDLLDLCILKTVGFSICPMDASNDIKNIVDYVSNFNGGEGVVREVIEIIIKAKGKWCKILNKYTC
ncbi:MAG: HAD hydrolase family protein [Endomicrobium sp.]|jgi:3-deoxy-D-manno-octulosonate 8-phosphate phosphatase (KDO 8-P phosphatase)|nr:HAD hydrolase family protein [Endomicrobium sp.]